MDLTLFISSVFTLTLAMEKLMGMILVTISVQMIMTGLKKFMAG